MSLAAALEEETQSAHDWQVKVRMAASGVRRESDRLGYFLLCFHSRGVL